MPLTVRLGPALDAALERYCDLHDVTKSLVVQESLAVYLVQPAAPGAAPGAAKGRRDSDAERTAPSPAFLAFERAGLIGAGTAGSTSADKAAVRKRITGTSR